MRKVIPVITYVGDDLVGYVEFVETRAEKMDLFTHYIHGKLDDGVKSVLTVTHKRESSAIKTESGLSHFESISRQ